MRSFDFSSWPAILTSVAGILLVTLIGMGIRLLMMLTIQQRRERQNRQINERLKALVAAYKVLGGSFTGRLEVDPTHLGDLRRAPLRQPPGPDPATSDAPPAPDPSAGPEPGTQDALRHAQDVLRQAQDERAREVLRPLDPSAGSGSAGSGLRTQDVLRPLDPLGAADAGARERTAGSDRARRVRDAVEAALSDIVLFGTQPQVELAAAAMREMAAGRPVHVHALVVSLRNHIREVLDLDPIPQAVVIPNQGPARPSGSSGRGGRGEGGRESGGRGGGGSGGGMGGGMAMGGGMGLGVGLGAGAAVEEEGGRG